MSMFQAAESRVMKAKECDFMLISSFKIVFLEASPNYVHLDEGYLPGRLETVALNLGMYMQPII